MTTKRVKTLTATHGDGTHSDHDTKYTITIWARDAQDKPVPNKLVSFKLGNNQKLVAGPTDDQGTISHTVSVGVDQELGYKAFADSDKACSNPLRLVGPEGGNPVVHIVRSTGKHITFKRLVWLLAAGLFLFPLAQWVVQKNGVHLPNRDAVTVSQNRVLQGLQDGYRDATQHLATLAKTDSRQAIALANIEQSLERDNEAKIGHPELTICGSQNATDKDGSALTIINDSCNPGQEINGVYHPGFVPWIYDGPEIVADVRILTKEGIPLDVVPELTAGRASEVEPLGGFRFRMSGSINYIQKIKPAGGQIVKVTPVKTD